MDGNVQNIPSELIYEMDNGTPIYYRGYKDFLNGSKQLDELMGSSFLQSDIITQLVILLGINLSKKFKVLTNEVGLQFSTNSWRSADIAILEKEKIKDQTNLNKYLEIVPDVVIEIDFKASLSEIQHTSSYFHKKTDQLLDFGVKKVVWIFTDSQKVMIAEKNRPWQTFNWNLPFEIIEKIEVNIKELIEEE